MRCLLFGGSGLLGSELKPLLEDRGYTVWAPASRQVDCRDVAQVTESLNGFKPTVVIMAAAKLGGILANIRHGSEFLYDNTLMSLVTLKACAEEGVPRVLTFGSACMYPKDLERPIAQRDLLAGPLEPTSELYSIGKIVATRYAQALRREGRCHASICVLSNLYGDQDNFSAEEGHLISSLMVKMHQAKEARAPRLELWGDGTPRRDFLHASDAAQACLTILEAQDPPEIIHGGTGQDLSIREIAEKTAQVVGFQGEIVFNGSVSNGTSRKFLLVDWLREQGWRPRVSVEEGFRRTYQHYLSHVLCSPSGMGIGR